MMKEREMKSNKQQTIMAIQFVRSKRIKLFNEIIMSIHHVYGAERCGGYVI